MSGERAPSSGERARLFVAVDLPGEVRSRLERWQSNAARGVSGLRKGAPGAMHATLCFLGWRDVSEIEEIGAACVAAVSGSAAPPLSFGRAIWLPRRAPRVLAVELEDESGELARLQAAVSQGLSAAGWYAPEVRPFLGHVTVARVGRGVRVRSVELPPVPSEAFEGAALSLYRSHLSPAGARYERLRIVEFGESGASGPIGGDPLAVVRDFHVEQRRAYAGGDLDALRPWLTDDVVWHVPGQSRIAGDHRGIDAVLAYFETRRRRTDETFRITVRGLSLVGDRVVQLAGGTAVVDGHEVSWETVGVFRVEDGRIAECWLVPFDLYSFDEIWG